MFTQNLSKYSISEIIDQLKSLELSMDERVDLTLEMTSRAKRFNEESNQRGESWHLPYDSSALPNYVWNSRDSFITSLICDLILNDTKELRDGKVSIQDVLFLAIARAHFADSKTGRDTFASYDSLQYWIKTNLKYSCSERSLKYASKVLNALGYSKKLATGRYISEEERLYASEHTGNYQKKAASVFCLITPKNKIHLTKIDIVKHVLNLLEGSESSTCTLPRRGKDIFIYYLNIYINKLNKKFNLKPKKKTIKKSTKKLNLRIRKKTHIEFIKIAAQIRNKIIFLQKTKGRYKSNEITNLKDSKLNQTCAPYKIHTNAIAKILQNNLEKYADSKDLSAKDLIIGFDNMNRERKTNIDTNPESPLGYFTYFLKTLLANKEKYIFNQNTRYIM